MKFNPSKVRLNIEQLGKLRKLEFWNCMHFFKKFFNIRFNLRWKGHFSLILFTQGEYQPTRGNFVWMSHQFTPWHLSCPVNVLNMTLRTLGGVRHWKDLGGVRCFSRCRRCLLVPILSRNCFTSLSGSGISACTCGHETQLWMSTTQWRVCTGGIRTFFLTT